MIELLVSIYLVIGGGFYVFMITSAELGRLMKKGQYSPLERGFILIISLVLVPVVWLPLQIFYHTLE